MATGRYSTFPTVIDKLKLLPELKDMTVEQVGKIARYNELIIKGKNGTLTSAEQLELDALHQEMKTYNLSPTDWNTVISAMINIEKYFNDTILTEVGTMVDNAELQINTSVTNGVNIVDSKVNSVIPTINTYINDLINNSSNKVIPKAVTNIVPILSTSNEVAIGISPYNHSIDDLEVYLQNANGTKLLIENKNFTVDTSLNKIIGINGQGFVNGDSVYFKVIKNILGEIPNLDVSLIPDNSINAIKLEQSLKNKILNPMTWGTIVGK